MSRSLLNRLGLCDQCGSELCTKGDAICCVLCGMPVPNHPLAAPSIAPEVNLLPELEIARPEKPLPRMGGMRRAR